MGNLKTIHQVAENAKRISFDAIARDSVEQTKENIPRFNKDNLERGFLTDGNRITPELQSPTYAAKKFNTGSLAPFGTPNLKLTGDFYRGIGTIINSKSFTTFSTDDKAPKLELKYSPLIYGLPDRYKPDYIKILSPVILKRTKDELFAGT